MKKQRQKFYSDGVTRIIDPFYKCRCVNGHQYWSITPISICSKCGGEMRCAPASEKKENPA